MSQQATNPIGPIDLDASNADVSALGQPSVEAPAGNHQPIESSNSEARSFHPMSFFQKIPQGISNLPIGYGSPFMAYHPSHGYYPLPPTLPLPPQATQSTSQAQLFSSTPLPTKSAPTSLSITPFPASTPTAQVENTKGTKSRGGKGIRGGEGSRGNKKWSSSRAASPAAALTVGITAAPAVSLAVGPAASPAAGLATTPTVDFTFAPTVDFTFAPTAGPAAVPTTGPATAPATTPAAITAVGPIAAPTVGFALAPAAAPITGPAAAPAAFLVPDVQGGIEGQEDHVQQRPRKKARTRNMNKYEKLVLIRGCCQHADQYRAQNKTNFWRMISELLKQQTGYELANPQQTVTRWINAQINEPVKEEMGSGTDVERNDFNTAVAEFADRMKTVSDDIDNQVKSRKSC